MVMIQHQLFVRCYLDDERKEPEGWLRTKTYEETIEVLQKCSVMELSLDHDLAFEHYAGDYSKEKTGYDVLLWIEEKINVDPGYIPPKIYIHTANPSARVKMELARNKIEKIMDERNGI